MKVIIFDFDGTIADTLATLIEIYNRIAPKFQCPAIAEADVPFIRHRKPQDVLGEYGVTATKMPLLLLRIRKEMHGEIPNMQLIPEMEHLLRKLHAEGFSLGILTSNSKENVSLFLRNHELAGIFDFIHTSTHLFGKDRALRSLLRARKIGREDAVYVGDETRDIEAARKVGVAVVAVTWGLHTRELLVSSQPTSIVDTPGALLPTLMKV